MTDADKLAAALAAPTDRHKMNSDIARDLTLSILKSVLALIPTMPEHFDGHEIRRLLAEEFARQRTDALKGNGWRQKKYRDWRYSI